VGDIHRHWSEVIATFFFFHVSGLSAIFFHLNMPFVISLHKVYILSILLLFLLHGLNTIRDIYIHDNFYSLTASPH
jgi:hypothetical protein